MTEGAARERIGHYKVEAPLGRGAMGTVYLARDERIGRRVALKQLRIDKTEFEDAESAAEFYMRLQREAEVCGSLQHPNIVTLYDVGYEGDRISYLALEYVAGETLLDLLKRHRPAALPIDVALRIAADILRGLAYAHGQGIVHRDIKPANILIAHDGVAKIADFGIARPQQSSMTVAGALLGTPNYMPPEQVKGTPATPQSDLFSLGVLLFEMVTGTKPFAAADLTAILEKIVRMPTPSAAAINAAVSPELDAAIQRLTAKAAADRFASATEALEAIERLRATAPVHDALQTLHTAASEATQRLAPDTTNVSAARRRIPASLFFAAIAIFAAGAAIPSLVISRKTDVNAPVRITPEQFAEFERKRDALRSAEDLFRSGEYQKSLQAYEAYLTEYPYSTVARDGADRARAALESEKAKSARNKQPPQKRTVMQDIKRSVKRLLRND